MQSILKITRKDLIISKNIEKDNGEFKVNSASEINEINKFNLQDQMMSVYLVKGSAPARLNASYNYYLKNTTHPTDIATGFVSIHQPKKYSHWGHGYISKGFDNVIMIRNYHPRINKSDDLSEDIVLNIEFATSKSSFEKSLKIKPNGWNFLLISKEDFSDKNSLFYSWKFKDKSEFGSMEAVWLAFSNESGSICGDHSF